MSSRLVSSVCSSPTWCPSRPCSDLLPELLETALATVPSIVTQISMMRVENGDGRPEGGHRVKLTGMRKIAWTAGKHLALEAFELTDMLEEEIIVGLVAGFITWLR